MRLDRKNRHIRIISVWLYYIGKPLYWATYHSLLGLGWLSSLLQSNFSQVRQIFLVIGHLGKRYLFRHTKKKKRVAVRFAIVGLIVGLVGCGSYYFLFKDLPTPQQLISNNQAVSTKLFDRNGILLYKIYKNENRSVITLTDLPQYAIDATLAIEDAEFFHHPGFSIRGMIRALKTNAETESTHGGSTITQQLVKNTLLSSEKTVTRKLKELILSLEVEYYFTKEEILTMYFNEVGYGGTAYGIEEAAQQYFGKSARSLSLAEAALLAGLPQSPTVYSPFGAHPELAINRQRTVLQRMVEEKKITLDEARKAESELLNFVQPKTDIIAPHFVMYVKDLLVKQYGERLVQSGGLEVMTTLDNRIQTIAEKAVEQELARLAPMHVTNAAALVIKPTTGEILAMVGSRNYFDTSHDGQVNLTLRSRQPGSSIKPLTYAYAFQHHLLTPATYILDEPVVYSVPGTTYAPQNYDGKFHGPVSVRQALANSYNIPAVKTLAQIGVGNLVNFAQQLGITTWNDPSRFGLSLTLGGGEVRMIDLAKVYATFANGGKQVPFTAINRVIDFTGKRQDDFVCGLVKSPVTVQAASIDCGGEQLIDPGVAYLISSILSDNNARSAAFGSHSVLVIPNQQVAVKTGTTNELRDNWTFGYTRDYLVATWVGNNDNSPMNRVASGITGASPIWHTIMAELLKDQPSHVFEPLDVVKLKYCANSQKEEYFLTGTQPLSSCVASQSARLFPDASSRDQLLDGINDTSQEHLTRPREVKKETHNNSKNQKNE